MNEKTFFEITHKLYWERDGKSIKNDYGKALLIGGSKNYPNAPLLALSLAQYAGDGYNALAVPECLFKGLISKTPLSVIFSHFPSRGDSFYVASKKRITTIIQGFSSILFGNGVAETKNNYHFLSFLIKTARGTLVIDATGLTLLAKYGAAPLKEKRPETTIILTPHLGEASRLFSVPLTGREPSLYQKEALQFAKENQVFILLKSYQSLLCTPMGKVWPSSYPPTPSLAKAGSGDALAGYLTGLFAYGKKECDVETLVLFGDEMIHRAMKSVERKLSPGSSSILQVGPEIQSLIVKAKEKSPS